MYSSIPRNFEIRIEPFDSQLSQCVCVCVPNKSRTRQKVEKNLYNIYFVRISNESVAHPLPSVYVVYLSIRGRI